jgi:GNAT superfamily N-acetyltransferase
VGRQTTRLTLDNLERLPGGCDTCVCWELDPVRRQQVRGHEAEEKAGWVSTVLRQWGSCGRVVCIDDEPVGHVVFAPGVFLPGTERFATAPASQDAVVLATGYVAPEHRLGGLGRMLVQGMATDLIRRGGINAVEAFGAVAPEPGECILPVDFLLAVGFKTHRPHPRYPRMRMDLRTAITWKEEVEAALGKLIGVVGKRREPVPDHRATRRLL